MDKLQITPNRPLTCVCLGIPAEYQPLQDGGYQIRIKKIDIPKTGHKFSGLRQRLTNTGELSFYVVSLDLYFMTEIEKP